MYALLTPYTSTLDSRVLTEFKGKKSENTNGNLSIGANDIAIGDSHLKLI